MEFENKIHKDVKEKMDKVLDFFHQELGSVRTGKASPALVENIMVSYYGAPTKLKELAGISTPEPRLIVVQPWDQGAVEEVFKALSKNDMGLAPKLEGKLVRVSVPELSEERRNDLKKVLRVKAEENRVSLRNIRRDLNEVVKKSKKDGQITEDDLHRIEKEIQHKTDEYIKKLDGLLEHKEKEIMVV